MNGCVGACGVGGYTGSPGDGVTGTWEPRDVRVELPSSERAAHTLSPPQAPRSTLYKPMKMS